MQFPQPVGVALRIGADERYVSGEGGIPDDCVEARIVALEYLRELDLPVEGDD